MPYLKHMLRRRDLWSIARPRILWIGSVRRRRRREVLGAFGERDAFSDQVSPTFVLPLVAQLLLGLPIGREASEKSHKCSVSADARTVFPSVGLPEQFRSHLQVVKRMASRQFGLVAQQRKDNKVSACLHAEQPLKFGHAPRSRSSSRPRTIQAAGGGILVDLVELLAGHVRDKQAKTHPTDIQTEVNRLN